MKFTTVLFALFATAAFVSAAPASGSSKPKGMFAVKAGSPNGFYTHHVALDGSVHTTYHGEANAPKPAATTTTTHSTGSSLIKRDRALGVQCQNLEFDADDAKQAIAGLSNMLNTNPVFYHSISYTHGTATVYGCDYGSGQNMPGAAMADYIDLVNIKCGNTKAGYFGYGSQNSAYGITTAGQGFC